MRRYLLGLALIAALMPNKNTQAQETIALSLEDAVAFARKNNVNVKNAQLDVLIQRAKNAEITGLAYPNVSASGQYQDFLNPQKSFLPGEFLGAPAGTFVPVQFVPKYSVTASGTASQILFDGSVLVALQARDAVLRISEQSAELSEEDVVYNVIRAYNSVAVAQKQYQILTNTLANSREMAYELGVMYESGFVEKLDIDRTNVQINNLATDSIRIGNVLTVTEQLLKFQMGMDIDQPLVLTDTSLQSKISTAQTLLLTEKNYNSRTEYNLLQTQLKLNQYDLKRHHLSGLPSLSTFANLGYNYATNTFEDVFKFRQNYQFFALWGLQLNVPIFDGLQRRNRVKQAEFAVEKTKNSLENIKLAIDFQTAQSRTTLKNSLLTLQSQERNMELARSVWELSRTKYNEGVGSNVEVTQAQTEYLQAQNNYFQALLDVVNAQVDLRKALGLL